MNSHVLGIAGHVQPKQTMCSWLGSRTDMVHWQIESKSWWLHNAFATPHNPSMYQTEVMAPQEKDLSWVVTAEIYHPWFHWAAVKFPPCPQRTRGEANITKCDFQQILRHPVALGSPMGAPSPNGLFIIVVSHVHYQRFCLFMRCTWNTHRPARDYRKSGSASRPGKKKRLRQGERRRWGWQWRLDHTDHQGPAPWSSRSVLNKCHLTLGEALLRRKPWICGLSLHWQEHQGFHGCLPYRQFYSEPGPSWSDLDFESCFCFIYKNI